MNIENNLNNPSPKSTNILEDKKQKVKEILENIEGLYKLLKDIVHGVGYGKFTEDRLSPHLEEVAKHMADNKEVEEAVKNFLSYGGEGYNFCKEGADIIKEDLPWVLVDELRKRFEEK